MKISFTTLSCPEWSWEQILEQAAALGYDGIEIRGVEGEMFLPKARPFLDENIQNTLHQLKTAGLEICCLDTSCSFHDVKSFDAAIKEGIDTIDLASRLGVPFIRVFGNNIPETEEKEEVIHRVAGGVEQLGEYAEKKNVTVLLETHGDFSASDQILFVMDRVKSAATGILWDINHPYKAFGEPIQDTYNKLKRYIKHTHIKDSKGMGANAPLCLAGAGDLPIEEAVELLRGDNFTGWFSLEWEKRWHPEIEEPEVALPAFIDYVKKLGLK